MVETLLIMRAITLYGSSDGKNSRFSNELNKIEVVGGGSGAFIWNQNDGGNNGGSGGGAKYQLTSGIGHRCCDFRCV